MRIFNGFFKKDKVYEKTHGELHEDILRIQETLDDVSLDLSHIRAMEKAFPTHWIYKHCDDAKQSVYRSNALKASMVGKYDRAIAICRDGLSKFPNDPYILYMLGRTLCDIGRVNKDKDKIEIARRTLDDVISQYPEFPDAYMERGWCKYGLGDFAGAERDCASAIERETEQLSIDSFVTRLNQARKEMPQQCSMCHTPIQREGTYHIHTSPERDVLNITEAKPVCKSCMYEIAHQMSDAEEKIFKDLAVAMFEKRYQDALDKLEEAYVDKKDDFYWYNRGNILNNLGKTDEALRCYNTALSMNTHYVKAWYRKGTFLMQKGVADNSEDTLMRALRCFVNVMRLNDKDWQDAAMFQVLMLAINIHNRFVTTGRKPLEFVTAAIQETHLPFYLALMDSKSSDKDIKEFQAEQKELLSTDDDEEREKRIELAVRVKMVDFCMMHYSKILDDIEPNIVAEVHSVEERKK